MWRVYHHCALRISHMLHSMRLRRLRIEVMDVIRRAEVVANDHHIYSQALPTLSQTNLKPRPLCS